MPEKKTEFTEQEAADELLIHKRTLQRAREAGKIDYIREGNKIRYTREALNAFEALMARE